MDLSPLSRNVAIIGAAIISFAGIGELFFRFSQTAFWVGLALVVLIVAAFVGAQVLGSRKRHLGPRSPDRQPVTKLEYQCWFCGRHIERTDAGATLILVENLWGWEGEQGGPLQQVQAHSECTKSRLRGATMEIDPEIFGSDQQAE